MLRRSTFMLAGTVLLASCYPRVKLSDAERARIPIHGRKEIVLMLGDSGRVTDTLVFRKWDRRYEAHFDVWYERRIRREPPRMDKKRGHYLDYVLEDLHDGPPADSGHLDVWSRVYFTKPGDGNELVLSIDDFTERHVLNASTPATVVFETRERPPAASCRGCAKKITWSTTEGLLAIELMDGSVWRRKEPWRSCHD